MLLFKKLVFFCFLFIIPWVNAEPAQNDSLIIYQKVESLLKESCNTDDLNPLIVSNDLKDVIFETSLIDDSIPIILIDSNFEVNNEHSIFLPKSPTYLLSTNGLKMILWKMKSSSWWNIESQFFIVEISGKSCDNAERVLQIMWKNNLLSSLFMCRSDDSVALYTYNPYANYAPYPWQQAEITINQQKEQWSLFRLLLNSSDTYKCSSLFFDKTKYLNGSKIIAGGAARPEVTVDYKKTHDINSLNNTLESLSSKLFIEIFSSLNAIPIIYYADLKIEANNQLELVFIQNLTNGSHDIGLNEIFLNKISSNISYTYPIDLDKTIIMTRPKASISPLEEIGTRCSIGVLLLTVLVLTITFIVIMLCKRPGFGFGCLEVLRLALSMSTISQFFRDSLRIFIASILFFVFIMNAIFQSRITAYSAKIKHDVVNNIDDLQNLKYTIYMKPYASYIIGVEDWSDEHKKYVHIVTNESCYKYVIEDNKSTNACIAGAGRNLPIVIENKLHVAFIRNQRFTNFYVRKYWPLKAKVDRTISQLLEGGILRQWQNVDIYQPIKKLKMNEVEILDVYREIIVSDLYYVYLTFGICLGIGFTMFIVEIIRDCVRTRMN